MAVLGTPSVSLQERGVQQWRQGAKKGASGPTESPACSVFRTSGLAPAAGHCAPQRVLTPPRALGKAGMGAVRRPAHSLVLGVKPGGGGRGRPRAGCLRGRGGSTHRSSLIFLRATSCPVSLFLALYTTP